MNLETLLQNIKTRPEEVQFQTVISVVEQYYDFTPTAFSNGDIQNNADSNQGSCKILSFAQLHHLTAEQTLHCFGDYYRKDVLANPEGTDHQNIRNFMKFEWSGIEFKGRALSEKKE